MRSDRPGVRLLARVVLPADVDPETNSPSFLTLQGTSVEAPDRWQRLELRDMPLAAERQARVVRAGTRRKVSLEGAYLDRLVVNLYGGPGPTEVFLDELRVEPVPPATVVAEFDRARARSRLGGHCPPCPARRAARSPAAASNDAAATRRSRAGGQAGPSIRLDRNLLTRDGRPWLPTIIRARNADPVKIRRAGFDILAIPADAPAEAIEEAASGRGRC